jgi:diguanylate cyclase (GGDEF)-like protein/PAS domain S-box-containing protein
MADIEKSQGNNTQAGNVQETPADQTEALKSPEISPEKKMAVFEALASDANRLLITTDSSGDLNFANAAIMNFAGYSQEEALKINYIDIVAPDDQMAIKEAFEQSLNGEPVAGVFRIITKNNITKWMDASVSKLSTGGVVVSMTDATENIKELEKLTKERDEAREKSLYDSLTGLHTKYHITETIKELQNKRSNVLPIGALFMDGDKFKKFNDTFGHAAGDRVIRRTASIIAETVRGEDMAARFGGDEFVILLPFTGEDGAKDLVDRLNAAIRESNSDEDWDLPDISVSMGYSVATTKDQIAGLLDMADKAMYDEKNDKKEQAKNEQDTRQKRLFRAITKAALSPFSRSRRK